MEIDRELAAAASAPAVLQVLAEGESHGHAILQRVRALSGGRQEWPDAMLYPLLHHLERLGELEARWGLAASGRRRRYYRLAGGSSKTSVTGEARYGDRSGDP